MGEQRQGATRSLLRRNSWSLHNKTELHMLRELNVNTLNIYLTN